MCEATTRWLSSIWGAAPPRRGEPCAELRTSTDRALDLKRKGNDGNVPQGEEASRATLELQTSYMGCTQVGAIPWAVGTPARAQRPVFSKVGTNPWSLEEIPPAVRIA